MQITLHKNALITTAISNDIQTATLSFNKLAAKYGIRKET